MVDVTAREVLDRLAQIEKGFRQLQKGYEELQKRQGSDALWEKITRLSIPILCGLAIAAAGMLFRHDAQLSHIEKTRFTREDAQRLETRFAETIFAIPRIREDIGEIKSAVKEMANRLRALESK